MFRYVLPALALAVALADGTTPASAAFVAYLSRTGGGSVCSQAQPCNWMAFAIAATGADNGEVVCLDKGFYGGVDITQNVTISCGNGLWEVNGTINVTLPFGSDVVIQGATSDAAGGTFASINMKGQGTLHLRNVRVGNTSGSSHAVNFAPTGPATLHITDSVFYNNGGSGVLIKPASGSSTINAHMRNIRFEHNLHGLFVDGTGSSGGIVVNVAESAAVDNRSNGIGAYTGGGNVVVSVTNSQINGNLNAGIGTLGVGPAVVAVRVGNSQITGNNWGVLNGGSGQIQTLGGNQLHTNVNDGTFSGSIATK